MEEIRVERDPPVATVTIDRAERRNALTLAMWAELARVFDALGADEAIRVVVLRGRGHFSAGADIEELGSAVLGVESARRWVTMVDGANAAIERCPKPVIAAISGVCLGAGLALAAACDLRIAASNARLGIPAARIGLTLGLSDTRRIVNALGPGQSKGLLMTNELISGRRAYSLGLVHRIVAERVLEAETTEVARTIATYAPLALRQAKENVNTIASNPLLTGVDPVEASVAWAGSSDFAEGIRAFVEGRAPKFTGC